MYDSRVGLEHLQLFQDIANTRSISQGAERNGISQSAATQHVRELERRLGTQLLDRATRPVSLTEAGELYLDFCRDVLIRQEEFRAALDQVRQTASGTLRVAAIYSVGLSEMTGFESAFRKRCPDAELLVEYLHPDKIVAAVREKKADLGIVSYPAATREIEVIPWREEEMVVAVAQWHPWSSRQSVEPADLSGVEFVAFDQELPIARQIDRYLKDNGVEVHAVMRFDNLNTIREAVALGSGVGILPLRILRNDLAEGRLRAIRLGPPVLNRPLGVIHLRRKKLSRAAAEFVEVLKANRG
jgi:DNA-binding transcriptional LysR family regulator